MYDYETCVQQYLGVAESRQFRTSPNMAVATPTKQYYKYYISTSLHVFLRISSVKNYLFSFLQCYHQRKIRWLERVLNSHLRVSRLPLYPLTCQVNGEWWRVLSNLSGRNISPRLNACL